VAAGLADAVMPFDAVMTEFTDALAAKQRLTQPGVARASPRSQSTQPVSSSPRSKPFTLENTMTDPKNDHDNPNEPTDTDPQTDNDPQPTPAAQAALAQSFASGRSQAQAIAEMCLIAGQSQRTAEFLAAGFSEAQVRRALLNARADQPEIASRITADAGTSQRPENSPVVAAVKKLTAKE
jgi:hypothetical protein